MSLATTDLSDEWVDALDRAGMNRDLAEDLTMTILADPRIIHAAPEETEAAEQLITRLDNIIEEARLDQFDSISNPESVRENLRIITREQLGIGIIPSGADMSAKDSDVHTADISDAKKQQDAVALEAGMTGEENMGAIERDSDENHSIDDPPETETDTPTPGSTEAVPGDESGQSPDDADTSQDTRDREEYLLEIRIAQYIVSRHLDILEDYEIDPSDVEMVLTRFVAKAIQTYETYVYEELFPSHPEHEAKVLYEQVVRGQIEQQLAGDIEQQTDDTGNSKNSGEQKAQDENTRPNDSMDADDELTNQDNQERAENHDSDESENEKRSLTEIAVTRKFTQDEEAIDSSMDVPLEYIDEVFLKVAHEGVVLYRYLVIHTLFEGLPEEQREGIFNTHLEQPAQARFETTETS